MTTCSIRSGERSFQRGGERRSAGARRPGRVPEIVHAGLLVPSPAGAQARRLRQPRRNRPRGRISPRPWPVSTAFPQPPIEDLPASERFFAGGDTTIRGFALDTAGAPNTISPTGFPKGGNALLLLNGELRVPVWRELGAAVFMDGGNVFNRVSEIDLDEIARHHRFRRALPLADRPDSLRRRVQARSPGRCRPSRARACVPLQRRPGLLSGCGDTRRPAALDDAMHRPRAVRGCARGDARRGGTRRHRPHPCRRRRRTDHAVRRQRRRSARAAADSGRHRSGHRRARRTGRTPADRRGGGSVRPAGSRRAGDRTRIRRRPWARRCRRIHRGAAPDRR